MIDPYRHSKTLKSYLLPDKELIKSEIAIQLLCELYNLRYYQIGESDINACISKYNWDKEKIWSIVNHLEFIGWIICYGYTKYKISGTGAVEFESLGCIEPNKADEQKQNRKIILANLGKRYVESNRNNAYSIEQYSREFGCPRDEVLFPIQDLEHLGYIETSNLRLTETGFQFLQREQKWEVVRREYAKVKDLSPQARGIAFEKLLAEIIRLDNWEVKHSSRSVNEENDLIIQREREFYLVEVKWHRNSLKANYIRDLVAKLSNRTGIHGVIFSMSGFTNGAIVQCNEQLINQTIFMFGTDDIATLIDRKNSFSNMLTSKLKTIIETKTSPVK